MLKTYLSKFTLEILPSILATVVGAYIVNQYIVTKPATDAPKAAVATVTPAKAVEIKPDASEVVPVIVPAMQKQRGPEKSVAAEKPSADKPAADKPSASDRPAVAEKAPEGAKRTQVSAREKIVSKPAPQAAALAADTVADERRDANELARAAIERLRPAVEPIRPVDAPLRAHDTARVEDAKSHDASKSQDRSAPETIRVIVVTPPQQALPHLPPPVNIATPAARQQDEDAPPRSDWRYPGTSRPLPPGNIPPPGFDMQASAEPPERHSVARDVFSAARSVIQSVLPPR